MKITITMDLDDDLADPDHEMGVTEAGFIALTDVLEQFGSDVEVSKADDD